MSNSKLSQKEQEEFNRLENEAIMELYQIIALAHQFQDIDYLDSMISAWKYKYKKILDNPSPDFRKKIEKLLNESYSKVVEYILSQIKLKEEKKIENQRKALRELYGILSDKRNHHDYDVVMDKIKKWETKYPYNSFLKMYQKRIDSAKREENIKQYAFKQEEAFKDLYYGVVNRSGTIEELQKYLEKWEDKYSINDNFTIDDFIKHQSEVKRYTSTEFLMSIAKRDDYILNDSEPKTAKSSLESQYSAYKRLETIINGKNNIDEIFKWVYDNNSIKFNDSYKQRIIQIATYFNDYSPKHLKNLAVPDIDFGKPALSIEQYNNIDEIKRYAVISYFNLLLPPSEAVSNNFFTKHIKKIYDENERRKHINIIDTFQDEVTNFIPKISTEKETDKTASSIEVSSSEEITIISDEESNVLDIEKLIFSKEPTQTIEIRTQQETLYTTPENPITSKVNTEENISPKKNDIVTATISTIESEFSNRSAIIPDSSSISVTTTNSSKEDSEQNKADSLEDAKHNEDYSSESTEPNMDYTTIISFLPVFFETINNYSIQAKLVQTTTKKLSEPRPFINSPNIIKTRNQYE